MNAGSSGHLLPDYFVTLHLLCNFIHTCKKPHLLAKIIKYFIKFAKGEWVDLTVWCCK